MKALTAAAVLVLGLAGPVQASGAISLATPDPHFGGTVTFTVTLDGHDKRFDCYGYGHNQCARVVVNCSQAGALVFGASGDVEQAREYGFLLGGGASAWIDNGGGPADCEAILFRYDKVQGQQTFVPMGSTTFDAGG